MYAKLGQFGFFDSLHPHLGLVEVDPTLYQKSKKAKLNICYSAPSRHLTLDNATLGALRYMARTKQRRTYLPLTFPSRSRYSFTDPERKEG